MYYKIRLDVTSSLILCPNVEIIYKKENEETYRNIVISII